ncbi:MAG: nucleotidyl transferase AbiEii/AbiGii toxin family protein [Candidatus Woesearchaeota archaeon]
MTTKIPIILKLKKQSQKDIARAQDIIVEETFKIFDKAVFHGGTAIWRCYNGNRFSEDVDVYIPKDLEKINLFFETLEKRGFKIEKKKIGENSLYSSLRINNVIVRFESLFKTAKGELKDYETVEGEFITVHCLRLEDIIKGKINAYSNRLKIRDMYDIFFLLRYVEDKNKIRDDLNNFIRNFKKPLDEKNLKVLIFDGLTPSVGQMLDYIGRK